MHHISVTPPLFSLQTPFGNNFIFYNLTCQELFQKFVLGAGYIYSRRAYIENPVFNFRT
jgi:hypothetical protein